MAHSWVTNFLLSVPLLFFSGSATILAFYFVSAVLFSLFCSPFSSHFLFQKFLSKSLVSFSQLINLPFSTSVYLHMSPGIFTKHSQVSFGKAAGRASLSTCGWEPEGSQPFWKTSLAICLTPHLPTVPSPCLWAAGTCSISPDTAMCSWDKPSADAPHGLSWEPSLSSCLSLSAAVVLVEAHQVPFLSPPRRTTKCQRQTRGKIGTTKNKSLYVIYGVPHSSRWQRPLFQAWSSVFLHLHFYGQKQLNQFKIVI